MARRSARRLRRRSLGDRRGRPAGAAALAALTERAEAALLAGRHVEVAADLEPVVAQDPRQEALAGLLMTALYRAGRQADALEVFARTRRHLDDELGLRALGGAAARCTSASSSRTRRWPPSRAAPAGATAPRSAGCAAAQTPAVGQAADTGTEADRCRSPTLRLIGRDEELAQLRDALTRQRMVTLVGPGGAGQDVPGRGGRTPARRPLRAARPPRPAGCGHQPADVPLAVADALGVPLDGADPNAAVRARLLAYLANRGLCSCSTTASTSSTRSPRSSTRSSARQRR